MQYSVYFLKELLPLNSLVGFIMHDIVLYHQETIIQMVYN